MWRSKNLTVFLLLKEFTLQVCQWYFGGFPSLEKKKKQKPAFCFQFWNLFLLQIRCKVDRIFKNILNQFFERCHFGYMIYYDLCGFLMLISQHLMSEKAMAPHSRTLAWKIPWTEEPGRLQSMGSRRVGHAFPFTFHFYALEKEMVTHSSVLAWRIPGMGSHRVRHDCSDLAVAVSMSLLFSFFNVFQQFDYEIIW